MFLAPKPNGDQTITNPDKPPYMPSRLIKHVESYIWEAQIFWIENGVEQRSLLQHPSESFLVGMVQSVKDEANTRDPNAGSTMSGDLYKVNFTAYNTVNLGGAGGGGFPI